MVLCNGEFLLDKGSIAINKTHWKKNGQTNSKNDSDGTGVRLRWMLGCKLSDICYCMLLYAVRNLVLWFLRCIFVKAGWHEWHRIGRPYYAEPASNTGWSPSPRWCYFEYRRFWWMAWKMRISRVQIGYTTIKVSGEKRRCVCLGNCYVDVAGYHWCLTAYWKLCMILMLWIERRAVYTVGNDMCIFGLTTKRVVATEPSSS